MREKHEKIIRRVLETAIIQSTHKECAGDTVKAMELGLKLLGAQNDIGILAGHILYYSYWAEDCCGEEDKEERAKEYLKCIRRAARSIASAIGKPLVEEDSDFK